MREISIEYNKEEDYYHVKFPNDPTPDALAKYFNNLYELGEKSPHKLRIITDITDVDLISIESQLATAKGLMKVKPYIRRSAIVGLRNTKKMILEAIIRMSRRDDLRVFDGVTEAKTWLFDK